MSKKTEKDKKKKQREERVTPIPFEELEAERAAGIRAEDAVCGRDDRGMGTVEVILIIVVLIGLVIIFKSQITQIVNSLFGKITSQTGGI